MKKFNCFDFFFQPYLTPKSSLDFENSKTMNKPYHNFILRRNHCVPFFSQFSKCFLKSPFVGKVTSQKRHWAMGFSLFLLSPQTLRMCFLRWERRPNRLPHSSHLKGRRWSWRVLMCIVTVESWRKAMPHLQQQQNHVLVPLVLREQMLEKNWPVTWECQTTKLMPTS